MEYELMWNRFQKHILACKKERYSKKELLKMIEGFKYAEDIRSAKQKKEGDKWRYIKIADRG
jgi:hypothetical protein